MQRCILLFFYFWLNKSKAIMFLLTLMFGFLIQCVKSQTLPRLCSAQQLNDYLNHMNNATFLSTGGYQLFVHTLPLPNLHPSFFCHHPQDEDSILPQDRSSCPWYYNYSSDPLRFPRYILTAKPKNNCFTSDNSSPRHCRNFLNDDGPNPNGVCEKVEIEVLTFRKRHQSDQCYSIGPKKEKIAIAFGCVYRRTQNVGSHRLNKSNF